MLKRGPISFSWRSPPAADLAGRRHTVVISDSPNFERTIVSHERQGGDRLTIPVGRSKNFARKKPITGRLSPAMSKGKAKAPAPTSGFSIRDE